MIDARGRDSRAALGLRHDEGPLQHRLCMQRQARGGPWGVYPMALHRLRDIRFHLGGVSADARRARLANVGVGAIDFLHHGPDKTGELGDFTFEDELAEIEVAQHAIERVAPPVVRCVLEKYARNVRPVISRGHCQRFFSLEMMKECSLGNSGLCADLIDRSGRIPLLAD